MRLFIFSIMLFCKCLCVVAMSPDSISVNDSLKYFVYDSLAERGVYVRKGELTEYDRRIDKYRKSWAALIPTQAIFRMQAIWDLSQLE